MRIAIGSDHAGFGLKQFLIERLSAERDLDFVDLGTHAPQPPVDYPDYARAVAEAVVRGEAERGVIVCGSGAGACIAAGKVSGARAFFAGDTYTAHQGVEHDDGNVLCLGERVTGTALALEIVRAFLRAEFSGAERHRRRLEKILDYEAAQQFPTEALRRQGQSLWIDTIARSMLTSGELRGLVWEDRVVGVTSNPTIFEKAMGEGPEYEAPAAALARQGKSTEEIYWALAIEDIQAAADILRSIYHLTDGLDGYVSLENPPAIANDTRATTRMTFELWRRLDRPNVMIKIPATPAGVPAIEEAIASGVNVNVTLMFSVELYQEVARAYIRGLERFFAGEGTSRLARPDSLVPAPVSVASFFVSRVDTLVDKLLAEKIAATQDSQRRGRLEGLLGRAAIANARLAYQRFKEIFSGPTWDALSRRGAHVQRPLWASTSTKNPRYRDVRYVEDLIGPHTVNTVPPTTLEAFKKDGRVARTVDGPDAVEQARRTLRELGEVGIDMDAVTLQLQQEGVQAFAESFDQLIHTLERRRQALVGASR
jgi:transaldolase